MVEYIKGLNFERGYTPLKSLSEALNEGRNKAKELIKNIVGAYWELLTDEQRTGIGKSLVEKGRENMSFDDILSENSGYLSEYVLPDVKYKQVASVAGKPNLEYILEKRIKPDKMNPWVSKLEALEYMAAYIEEHPDEIRCKIEEGYKNGKSGIEVFTDIMYNTYKEVIKKADKPKIISI